MVWFSPCTTYGYAAPDILLFHVHNHTICADLQWIAGEGDIHLDFDTSDIVLVMCQSYNILVLGSGILSLALCYHKCCIPGL